MDRCPRNLLPYQYTVVTELWILSDLHLGPRSGFKLKCCTLMLTTALLP
jgi:hypothetical protein